MRIVQQIGSNGDIEIDKLKLFTSTSTKKKQLFVANR